MKIGDIKEIIQESLGFEKSEEKKDIQLTEAYVAMPKSYNLNSELLSKKAKDAHFDLYEGYIKSLNRVNVELEASDKNANNYHSEYRSLKIDETYLLNAVFLHELFFANV